MSFSFCSNLNVDPNVRNAGAKGESILRERDADKKEQKQHAAFCDGGAVHKHTM